jgi:hypothetical protein
MGVARDKEGETKTITAPEEVKEYIQAAWETHFKARELPDGDGPDKWISEAQWIMGDTSNLTAGIKLKEIKDTLQRIANRKAPGPTGETIEMLKWLDNENI